MALKYTYINLLEAVFLIGAKRNENNSYHIGCMRKTVETE